VFAHVSTHAGRLYLGTHTWLSYGPSSTYVNYLKRDDVIPELTLHSLQRSRGIAIFQLFGRLSSFFTTFVNPIGMKNISWRYLISYCCFLAFEIVFVCEWHGRTSMTLI